MESIRADAVTPNIGFADINADGTIDVLTILDLAKLFVIIVDGIRADPTNVSAIPFNFKLPTASIVG